MMTNHGNARHAGPVLVPARPDRRADHARRSTTRSSNGWARRRRVHRRPAPAQHLLGDVRQPDVRPSRIRPAILLEINACRKTFPSHYIRVHGVRLDAGWSRCACRSSCNRPPKEPGFGLARQEGRGPAGALPHLVLRDRQARRRALLTSADAGPRRAAADPTARGNADRAVDLQRARARLARATRCWTSSIASWSAWRR